MPASTLGRKISIDNFFQNLDEISGELDRVSRKTDKTAQEVESASTKAFSNENYLQSLLQSITTQEEIIQNVSSDNQQQNTIINNLTNVVQQSGDQINNIEKTIVNQTTDQINNIEKTIVNQTTDQINNIEKTIVNQTTDQINNIEKTIVNQTTDQINNIEKTIVNQTTDQITEVNNRIEKLERLVSNTTTNQIVGEVKSLEQSIVKEQQASEKIVDQIVTIKRDNTNETQQISKAFGILRQVYDSLATGVQGVRSDVEGITQYLLKDQRQRQDLLVKRKFKAAQEADIKEKQNIKDSFKNAVSSIVDEKFSGILSKQDYNQMRVTDAALQGGTGTGGGDAGTGAGAAAGALGLGLGAGAISNMMGGGETSSSSSGGGSSASVGTPEQKAMLKAISFAEGTSKGYGIIYGGANVPELERGELTVSEVLEMQRTGKVKGRNVGYKRDKHNSDATGKYQFMSYTLKEEIRKQGISPNEKFTPALQDKLILGRISSLRRVTPELLKKEGMSTKVLDRLAPEFASFPYSPKGNRSYYGQPVKSPQSIQNAYKQALGTTSQQSQTAQSKPAPGAQTSQAQAQSKPAPGAQTSQAAAQTSQRTMGASLEEPTREVKVSSSDIPSAKEMEVAAVQPQRQRTDTSSIVPFDAQQMASNGGRSSQMAQNQVPMNTVSTTPDHPGAIPTSNPLTRMWTLSAINHLNINGSIDHIYG